MALIVTIGAADADSYATVAEADTYHSDRGNTAWAALSNGDKEAALRYAAVYVDTYPFTGYRETAAQALQWPRVDATRDGWAVSSGVIPVRVKHAQIEAALRQSTAPLSPDIAGGSVVEETVGPLTVRYDEYTNTGRPTYPEIDALLRPFLGVGGALSRQAVRV